MRTIPETFVGIDQSPIAAVKEAEEKFRLWAALPENAGKQWDTQVQLVTGTVYLRNEFGGGPQGTYPYAAGTAYTYLIIAHVWDDDGRDPLSILDRETGPVKETEPQSGWQQSGRHG